MNLTYTHKYTTKRKLFLTNFFHIQYLGLGRGGLLSKHVTLQTGAQLASAATERISPMQKTARSCSISPTSSVSPPPVDSGRSLVSLEKRANTSEIQQSVAAVVAPKPLSIRGRGLISRMGTSAAMPSGAAELPIPQVAAVVLDEPVTAPEVEAKSSASIVPPGSALLWRKTLASSSADDNGGRALTIPTTDASSSKADTQYMSVAVSSDRSPADKAVDDLQVERIMRKSPIRRSGEAGVKAQFATNYVKLKCNNTGVYQYVVHYDPPVDSQFLRIKMVTNGMKSIVGEVNLFDGYTLFLPILLKEQVCCFLRFF